MNTHCLGLRQVLVNMHVNSPSQYFPEQIYILYLLTVPSQWAYCTDDSMHLIDPEIYALCIHIPHHILYA